MRIGVAGILGRMGRLVAAEIVAAGADLAGGVARGPAADVPAGVWLCETLGDLARISDVIIDFTRADAAAAHADCLAESETGWVLGTTGLSAAAQARVRQASARIAIVQAANFSPGVNLVLALAGRLARALPADEYDAEILDMHHRQKIDAPSGTALALGRAVAAGRGVDFETVAQTARDGQAGPRAPGTIGFAALRGGQVVGEHTLLFAAAGEQIALTHRALDRNVFAGGAVRAAHWLQGRPPGLYSMMDVLGMTEPA